MKETLICLTLENAKGPSLVTLEYRLISSKYLSEIKELVKPYTPEFCYQCAKCTSACTASKVVLEYRPHLIIALTRLGFIKQLLDSGIIWACTECWKCSEYCPQRVAPAEVVIALKNLAIAMGYKPPADLTAMARNICDLGYVAPPIEIVSKEFEMYDRKSLNLPELSKPYAHDAMKRTLNSLLGYA